MRRVPADNWQLGAVASTMIEMEWNEQILERLDVFGIRPRPSTDPILVRDYLKALYTMEIRFLREEQKARERSGDLDSRRSYAARVIELRRRYDLLEIPVEMWRARD